MKTKTLVIYDSEGNILFTMNNATKTYKMLVTSVGEGQEIDSVDTINNKIILRDAPKSEIEKTNEQLLQLQAKIQEVMTAVDTLVMGGEN